MSGLIYRELYAPAHFGNSYEVSADYEMREILKEAMRWGFNAYGDWFDTADLNDPYDNPQNHYLLPQAIWERKIRSFRTASELELMTNLVTTPNHVFQNQLANPALLAETSGDERIFGQLLCPSVPEARDIILKNHHRLFADFKDAGINLDSITGGPYDYGGCSCKKCTPWIVTFGKLFAEIHDTAKEYFPGVAARLFGWWWTREETQIFKKWADAEQPGRFVSISAYIPYGHTHPDTEIALAEGCELHAFVHIGYPDTVQPHDRYGWWGPCAAPGRLEKTVRNLNTAGATGFAAYSEGISDDVNKALLAGIASGAYADSASVLEEYAKRYFGADGDSARRWADWLAKCSRPFEIDFDEAGREFESLAANAKPEWRLEQWRYRVRIMQAHYAVLSAESTEAKAAAKERFFEERDRLYREVWKLGLVRHVLNPKYAAPSWLTEEETVESKSEA